MSEQTPIIGKIAKIQDKYRVIINKGRIDGVKPNMKFYVYEEGDEIVDPDTKEFIEKEEVLKGYLKTIHVQDKISILESDEKESVTVKSPLIFSNFNSILGETRKVMKPLDVDLDQDKNTNSTTTQEGENLDTKIKRGDLVKQIIFESTECVKPEI